MTIAFINPDDMRAEIEAACREPTARSRQRAERRCIFDFGLALLAMSILHERQICAAKKFNCILSAADAKNALLNQLCAVHVAFA